MDGGNVERELCANCKKEIPQTNYVMHTAHCARNITLCKTCNEPIPKSQFDDHKKQCEKPKPLPKKPSPPPTTLERSSYFQQRKTIEDEKIAKRRERYLDRHEKLVDTGYSLRDSPRQNSSDYSFGRSTSYSRKPEEFKKETKPEVKEVKPPTQNGTVPRLVNPPPKSSGLLACKFCDLELPKLDLEEHENYCGSRTDKCLECGELVMFKNKQLHLDSNHGFLKLNDEPGPRASWDSTTQRTPSTTPYSSFDTSYVPRRRPQPFRSFDFDPMQYLPSDYVPGPPPTMKVEKGESYKEISRRLDCKTEYIRNLLHDSASITVPLRHSGAVPRNHFNHNKASPPPTNVERSKMEILQTNHVMHTAPCNEPIPKSQFDDHKQCEKPKPLPMKPSPPPTNLERSSYYQQRKMVEDEKIAKRQERYLDRHEKLVDTGYSLRDNPRRNSSDYSFGRSTSYSKKPEEFKKVKEVKPPTKNGTVPRLVNPPPKSSGLLACKYCDLKLPKLNMKEHENYCVSRMDKCLECGELVSFKDKQLHIDWNHGFLKLNDGPAPQPPLRRRNPPTELTIPCEFCQTPIPHEELIQHETGCRPDLARYNPRRNRSPEEDDYFVAPPPSSPEVQLPCEFCADMIPASQLLRHQATCT